MRNLLILLLLLLIANPIFAEENKITNDQAYGTINLQKQPQEGKQKQGITNHFTFFTINVQVNGKIKDSDTDNK